MRTVRGTRQFLRTGDDRGVQRRPPCRVECGEEDRPLPQHATPPRGPEGHPYPNNFICTPKYLFETFCQSFAPVGSAEQNTSL